MEIDEVSPLLAELRKFGENVRNNGADHRDVLGGIDLWLAKFCKKFDIPYISYYKVFRPAYATKLKAIDNCENIDINKEYFGDGD